jgi:hypothetical protein
LKKQRDVAKRKLEETEEERQIRLEKNREITRKRGKKKRTSRGKLN